MNIAGFWKTIITVLGKASSWIVATFVFFSGLSLKALFLSKTYLYISEWNRCLWAEIPKFGFSS